MRGPIATLGQPRNLVIKFSMSTFELDEPATVCLTLNSYYTQRGEYKAGRGISPRKVSSNDRYQACVLLNQ